MNFFLSNDKSIDSFFSFLINNLIFCFFIRLIYFYNTHIPKKKEEEEEEEQNTFIHEKEKKEKYV